MNSSTQIPLEAFSKNETADAAHDGHSKMLAERERRLATGESHLMELDDFITAMQQTMPTPTEWHFEVLAERERMLAAGETEIIGLEQFSKELLEEL